VAANVQRVTLAMKLEGFAGIKNIGKDFKNLNKTLKLTAPQLDKLVKSITKVHGNTKLSKAAFEKQISALTKLKNNVGIGTVAYKKLSTELDKVRAKMNAVTDAAAPQGGMFARLNKRFKKIPVGGRAALGALAGTATAGLGSTGQLAFAGGAVGGPAGVAIGAGLGAAVDLAKFGAESASYASQIQKLQIALRGVTKNQGDFVKGLDVISTTSKKLNVPIAASTKQFTTLSASVLGAGGSIEDAELVFTGVSNAIKATGGNAEDVQSAIRAMSQIFGKGKVSAEELQGQLGERLAGAVVKFAEANGSSLAKLQKDLRDGTVGLDQVIKFAQKLNVDFAETAEKVANSSADAGQRLKTTMDRLKLAVGTILQPIGAEFQRVFANIVGAITDAIEAFNKFMGIGLGNAIAKTERNIESLRKRIEASGDKNVIKRLNAQLKEAERRLARLLGEQAEDDEGGTGGLPPLDTGDNSPLKSFAKSAFDLAKQTEEAFVNAFKGMEDALVKFVTTGKLNFKDLANSIIADLTRMLVRYAIVQPLFFGIFPSLKPSAKGNVFAENKIVPYAKGGVVTRPTIFPMADGMGLMAEAGPEAVMPLKRGRGGRLGVEASGGVGNIVVNVDASGSSVQGDSAQSEQFGRALAAAIQSELISQQRPGGLLS
jgi:tape measure domain-containing protein